MNKLISFLVSIAFWLILNTCRTEAQTTIYYRYDDSGNRILRTITLSNVKTARPDTSDLANAENNFLDSLGSTRIIIYPNPTKGQLRISLSGTDNDLKISLYLYNLTGKLLIDKSPVNKFEILDISPYPSGSYILKITLDNKASTWKIIKE